MSSTKATTDAGKSIITGGAPGASRSGTKSAINFPTQNEIESFQNQCKFTSFSLISILPVTVEKIDQLNKAFIAQKSSSYQGKQPSVTHLHSLP